MAFFAESIGTIRLEISEESRGLRTVRREVNPLKAKGENPIKKLVKTFRKARSTRDPGDIAAAKSAHRVGEMYANQHGLPRLAKQITQHVNKIPKPKKPLKSIRRKAISRRTSP